MDLVLELRWLMISVSYLLVALVAIVLSKICLSKLTPFSLDEELTVKDNPAMGLAVAAYYVAVVIIFLGAAVGPSGDELPATGEWLKVLGLDLVYACVGIVLLNVNRVVIDKLILSSFSVRKEIVEDRNVGTGAVEGGCLIASALSIAGAIHGEGSWVTAVVFYGVGLVVLIAFGLFQRMVTPYDLHGELERDNVPAGVAFGMNLIAIGVLLLKATHGDFVSWEVSLGMLAFYSVAGFVSLLVLNKLVDLVLFPGTTLKHEIVNDRNLNAAFIEGAVNVSFAASVFLLF